MTKRTLIFSLNKLFFFTAICSKIWSQDVHFSNIEYAPLTLNPALSGNSSSFQALINYRNQWNSINSPFETFSASVDGRLTKNRKNRNGFLAGGVYLHSDKSGDLQLTDNTVNLNLAYHLRINRQSTFGLGLYGGFGQRSISMENAKWSNQYDGNSYNSAIGGEVLSASSLSFIDVGAGCIYSIEKSKIGRKISFERINVGAAFYHLNTPNNSFLNNDDENLNMRFTGFMNGEFNLKNSINALLPGVYFQKQGSASQILYGMNYRHNISKGTTYGNIDKSLSVYAGLFHRWNDALVLRFMLEFKQFMIGTSYDINISKFSTATRTRGGFEFFLKFNLDRKSGMSRI